jgi:hypothetical protein
MANVQLNTPVLTGGILNTNFFNGRVLAAEDLTALQTANAQQRRQLGRAIGEGVVCGLEVTLGTSTDPSVTLLHVAAGLALDRKGDAVALSTDVDVAITTSLQLQSATNGLFAACQPPQGMIATNLDCYVLTISPASGLQGSAPMTSALSCGFAPACASANVAEGVQFGLLPLSVSNTSNTTPLRSQALQLYATLAPQFVTLAGLTGAAASALQAQIAPSLSQFQNVVAHLCFGTDVLQGFSANPFAATNGDSLYDDYGVLDDLREQGYLTDCAVPLALVYWTAAGVQFVDMWSVRRPVFPTAASELWPVFSGRRRTAEGLAMFLQFQDQINEMVQSVSGGTVLTSVTASDYFRYLPPIGLLPLSGTTQGAGFSYQQFFAGQTLRSPIFTRDARVLWMLRTFSISLPIDVTSQELIWLYLIPSNSQLSNQASGPLPYLIFAGADIPYQGDSRYNASYWNYSNYSLTKFEGGL